jgi:Zn-dependent peptidase ImmA (M78 family)
MKDSEKLRSWVKKKIKYYCKSMGIKEKPAIIFDLYYWNSLDNYDHFGSWYEGVNFLSLNFAMHKNKEHMEYTLCHELVHAKHNGKIKHGKKFDAEVDKYYKKKKGKN